MGASMLVRAGRRAPRLLPPALGLIALAFLTYLYLPLRALASTKPIFMWGETNSFSGFWQHITGSAYASNFSDGDLLLQP